MTSDEFSTTYRLLRQIGGGGRSYTAEHRRSSRAVLVHFLDNDAAALRPLLERLPPRDRSRVLETLTVDGTLVVVTQFLENFDTFEAWLRSRASGATTPLPSPSPPPRPPAQAGEFTQLFGAADTPASKPASPEPSSGGFTELFRTPSEPAPGPTAGPLRATPPPVRVVGLRVPTPPEPGPPEAQPPVLRPKFTAGDQPAGPLPEQPERPLLRQQVLLSADSAPQTPVPPPPPAWSGPSEYTRELNRGAQLDQEPMVLDAPEPVQPPLERKTSWVPLLLGLNLIVIVATGLILYFALKRC